VRAVHDRLASEIVASADPASCGSKFVEIRPSFSPARTNTACVEGFFKYCAERLPLRIREVVGLLAGVLKKK